MCSACFNWTGGNSIRPDWTSRARCPQQEAEPYREALPILTLRRECLNEMMPDAEKTSTHRTKFALSSRLWVSRSRTSLMARADGSGDDQEILYGLHAVREA